MPLVNEIKELEKHGYQVERFTQYHYRVESVLDVYIENKRFHNIANQERGRYPHSKFKEFEAFVLAQIATADRILDDYLAQHPGALDEGKIECEFCGYYFEEKLGRFGCPNCHGEGLGDRAKKKARGRWPMAEPAYTKL